MELKDTLSLFGIDADRIKRISTACECAIEESCQLLREYDKENDDLRYFNWEWETQKEFDRNNLEINLEERMCNAILSSTTEILNKFPILSKFGVEICQEGDELQYKIETVDGYIQNPFTELGISEFRFDISKALCSKMLPAIEKYLDGKATYPADFLEDDLNGTPPLNTNEILACINEGEIVGAFKEQIDKYAIPVLDKKQDTIIKE